MGGVAPGGPGARAAAPGGAPGVGGAGTAEGGGGAVVADGGDPGRGFCAKATAPRVASVAIAPAERKGGGRMVPEDDGILCDALRQMVGDRSAMVARFSLPAELRLFLLRERGERGSSIFAA